MLHGHGHPKALLPLGAGATMGQRVQGPCLAPSFLSRQVALLSTVGVQKVFVVVREQDLATFAPLSGAPVDIVPSRFSSRTVGSGLSLLCGLEAVAAWRPHGSATLVVDADILYERRLLELAIAHCERSRLFTVDRVSGDAEEVRVYGQSAEEPVLIGKGLGPTLTDGLELLGESVGMIYLAPGDERLVTALIRWLAGDPHAARSSGGTGQSTEHEDVWQYMFSLRRLQVARLPGDLLFAECDSPHDYDHIRSTVFPAILQGDQAT